MERQLAGRMFFQQIKNRFTPCQHVAAVALGCRRVELGIPRLHGDEEPVVGDFLEAIGAQLESVTQAWSNGVQHPDWPIKIVAAKYNAVETAWKIADRALEVSGGFGMFKKSEMERLFRDARAGRFHPANSSLTHELLGKLVLGVNPDDPQRWG